MGNRIRSMTERMNDENARLRADLARVTAEREAAIVEAQQAAKDRALMKAQLDRAEVGRDRLRAALQSMLRHLSTARDCIDNSHRFYQSRAAFSAVQEARAALNGEGEG